MVGTSEAFSRVMIDAQIRDQGWDVLYTNANGTSNKALRAIPVNIDRGTRPPRQG